MNGRAPLRLFALLALLLPAIARAQLASSDFATNPARGDVERRRRRRSSNAGRALLVRAEFGGQRATRRLARLE